MVYTPAPIKFGTDGWRGVIAAEFTFERVARVASVAAQVLAEEFGGNALPHRLIVGYDRRFMAEQFAQLVAQTVKELGFEVWLSESYAPTPAFSWAAHQEKAIGALVLTASHNPANYLGLKVKGAFGGSVGAEITEKIEAQLENALPQPQEGGSLHYFDPWPSYCQGLQAKVDVSPIRQAIHQGKLRVFADVMHGAAATGLERLLGCPIDEINGDRDPLFGGGSPEPLPKYVPKLLAALKIAAQDGASGLRVGLIFDGDADRIAAVDGQGNFLSSQGLIPILIYHLATQKGLQGEIVKTVSGSDLIPKLAELYGIPLTETAIGYKYIADRMLTSPVLIGGEESGGIGYGGHIPERDALLSALYVLETVVQCQQDISEQYQRLQQKVGFVSEYDRIDLPLSSMDVRTALVQTLNNNPLTAIAGEEVTDLITTDGYKFRMAGGGWLLIRFSGTEPLLRLYCEAPTSSRVQTVLHWAKDWANGVASAMPGSTSH
ncbi:MULTISPECIES: phosphoglucomutase/phosphomannomutase family protein [unclassified Synechocystis]|uniref:phosphoglucomutase/phosphomannomutase family protein n=1 Tax=unclassified Synechocystis TaxID=2640012 RepID=UPI000421B47A|nr:MULTISPECIES: phosphoglucomutase/phosphomannomutase family protein [unclassified Synechocystis]AIE74792.1 Phosphoglucosamine mutase [Synechocystis sp. PCC 6714]MCT0253475.1 phosphoglucomutase/phosphomannomutase family protein [Synechocystis sp. CS-94]